MSSHGGRRSGSGRKKIFASNSARLQFWRKTRKRISLDGTVIFLDGTVIFTRHNSEVVVCN